MRQGFQIHRSAPRCSVYATTLHTSRKVPRNPCHVCRRLGVCVYTWKPRQRMADQLITAFQGAAGLASWWQPTSLQCPCSMQRPHRARAHVCPTANPPERLWPVPVPCALLRCTCVTQFPSSCTDAGPALSAADNHTAIGITATLLTYWLATLMLTQCFAWTLTIAQPHPALLLDSAGRLI